MSTTQAPPPLLGRCPDCHMQIASLDILLEDDPPAGPPVVRAECPRCDHIVTPE